MIRYRLNRLAGRRKGTQQLLPPIAESRGAEVALLKVQRAVLRPMAKTVRDEILPQVARGRVIERAQTFRLDEAAFLRDDMFDGLRLLTASLLRMADDLINRIFEAEGKRHTRAFAASAKAAMSVDLGAVVAGSDIEPAIEAAAQRAAGLIKGLADDTVKRIANKVLTAVLQGKSIASLKAELVKEFGIADRRAQLIARDQIATVNSDLNRIRHKQAGITKYRWMTSLDERVRPLHQRLHGREYRYDEPTGAEGGLPPGQPINCRCIAQPIVEF